MKNKISDYCGITSKLPLSGYTKMRISFFCFNNSSERDQLINAFEKEADEKGVAFFSGDPEEDFEIAINKLNKTKGLDINPYYNITINTHNTEYAKGTIKAPKLEALLDFMRENFIQAQNLEKLL